MATRLVHPIRSSGRRGWRGPVSDAEGPCPIRSWPVDGAGRGWDPRSTAGAGFGILADLILADPARGVRGVRPQLNPTRITRLPSCSRASTPSMPMRLSDRGHGHGWSTSGDRGRPPPSNPRAPRLLPPAARERRQDGATGGSPLAANSLSSGGGGGGRQTWSWSYSATSRGQRVAGARPRANPPPPCQQVCILNSLILYLPVLCATQQCATQTFVLGSMAMATAVFSASPYPICRLHWRLFKRSPVVEWV